MVLYKIACSSCEIFWEVEASMAKPPKRRRCPECNVWCPRVFTVPAIRFLGTGFYTNRSRAEKFNRDGFDRVQAEEFYKSSIEHSKERVKTGYQHYSKITPNIENMTKSGMIKKVDSEKAEVKKQKMREMTIESHKKAGLDPTKPIHPQAI